MAVQNHYAVLGVSRTASLAEIKAAYNQLVLVHHPDKGGSQPVFLQIQGAWEVLRNAPLRAVFDKQYPSWTGEVRQPQFATGEFGTSAQVPKKPKDFHPHGGDRGGRRNPNPDPWNGYRESHAGNAYQSWKSTDKDRPEWQWKPRPENDRHRRETREPKDTPMADSTNPPRPRKSSPPPFRPSQFRPRPSDSPSPAPPTEENVEPMQALADQAGDTLRRYKRSLSALRTNTCVRTRANLSREIQIKLEHVSSYLTVREMRLKLRVYETKERNANIRANQHYAPEPFFAALEETVLNGDVVNVSDLANAMGRVLRDTQEMNRMRRLYASKGQLLPADDKAVVNLKSSTDSLDKLLVRVLSHTPGVGPPQGLISPSRGV